MIFYTVVAKVAQIIPIDPNYVRESSRLFVWVNLILNGLLEFATGVGNTRQKKSLTSIFQKKTSKTAGLVFFWPLASKQVGNILKVGALCLINEV